MSRKNRDRGNGVAQINTVDDYSQQATIEHGPEDIDTGNTVKPPRLSLAECRNCGACMRCVDTRRDKVDHIRREVKTYRKWHCEKCKRESITYEIEKIRLL